jgi:hypothetical protein
VGVDHTVGNIDDGVMGGLMASRAGLGLILSFGGGGGGEPRFVAEGEAVSGGAGAVGVRGDAGMVVFTRLTDIERFD